MSLVVVGSIAYDSIQTPHGAVEGALGGSAVYFSLAASVLSDVRLVGVVGEDFGQEDRAFLDARPIDTSGLEIIPGGKTFRWSGEYAANMNDRQTLSVDLNVLDDFEPKLPMSFRDSSFVFLANAAPATQATVLDQVASPKFVMADTMDLWIQTAQGELLDLLKRVDGLMVNDSEALLLTDTNSVMAAGETILDLGPSIVVVKKGEHGALLFTSEGVVPLPAYPVKDVQDPTGAGDSFAGAFMGHVSRSGTTDLAVLKEALAHGTVAASFTVQNFGVAAIAALTSGQQQARFEHYRSLLGF